MPQYQCDGRVAMYGGRKTRQCRNQGTYSIEDSNGVIFFYCKHHYEPIADKKRAERQKEQDIAYKARLQEQKLTQAKIDAYPILVKALVNISINSTLTATRAYAKRTLIKAKVPAKDIDIIS